MNIGDCLRDWSGGRLVSTKHRVVLPPGEHLTGDLTGPRTHLTGDLTGPRGHLTGDLTGPRGQLTGDSTGDLTWLDSTEHRVGVVLPAREEQHTPTNPTNSQRLSLAYFVTPNHDTLLHPFPIPPHPVGLDHMQVEPSDLVKSSDAIASMSVSSSPVASSVSPVGSVPTSPQGVILTYGQWRKRRISSVIKVGR